MQRHIDSNYGSPDIAATLDAMKKVKILKDNGLIYIPIRSSGQSEQNYNITFWQDPELVGSKLGISENDYHKAGFVYQNIYLLETLIDNNVPVAVNALEHTRTLVGYNDDKFIFADNWGASSKSEVVRMTSEYAELEDEFIAGYSTVNKCAIVSNLRDLVFWNN